MSCGSRGLIKREKSPRDWLGVPPAPVMCGERERSDLGSRAGRAGGFPTRSAPHGAASEPPSRSNTRRKRSGLSF